jgi:hypothetical protein
MATLTVTPISRAGIPGTLVAAAGGGDDFLTTGKEYLEIVNGGGSPITVSAIPVPTVDGLTVPNKTITVTNGQRRLFGPFPTGLYANTTTGRVAITYSGVTSVTVGAFSLTQE